MKKTYLVKITSVLTVSAMLITSSISFAHSGRTDSRGGHKDNSNASGLGSYHYHCGGHSPHLHNNGTCPYTSKSKSKSTVKTSSSNTSIKVIQTKLNSLGYNCGKPDGVSGAKTVNAIKSFQKSKGLKADGKVGSVTRKALGL